MNGFEENDFTRWQDAVAIVGSGYVGSVVAACLAHVGHRVIGVEAERDKLRQLAAGRAPLYEPGLDELIAAGLGAGRLSFTDDLASAMAHARVVFLCVGTPSSSDGQPDMTALRAVATVLGDHVRSGQVIVTKSTVPIGTGRWLAALIDDRIASAGREPVTYGIVSNPEFLREGYAVSDYLRPDRVVLGSDDVIARDVVAALYRPILEQDFPGARARGPERVPLVETGLSTAEMIKYASNGFLAMKISYANEIARLCEYVGADVNEVTEGMGLDHRVGPSFLRAGLGWGGSCLGKDLLALMTTASDYGYRPRLLDASIVVNAEQRQLVVERLLHALHSLRGARIAVLGLAFKPHTDDIRDSPGVEICRRLLLHDAIVSAYDPMVKDVASLPELRIASDAAEAVRGVDAVLLATDWPEFVALDLAELAGLMHGRILFDGRNAFDPDAVHAAGLRYLGIGRPLGDATEARIRLLPEPASARPG